MKLMNWPQYSTLLCVLLACAPVGAQQPAIEPSADQALKEMSAKLAAARSFSFESHSIADQLEASGEKIQRARNQKILIRRPDHAAARIVGDSDDLQFAYDGKQVTLLNRGTNVYASTDAKPSIDDTLDMLASEYGLAMPLADLVFADPYKTLIEHVRSGRDLGDGYVFDTKCRHLAFRQEFVDWQIWIDQDEKLPRKIVITYKEQPGHPEYTAFLSKWNLSSEAPDSAFELTPPAGATKTTFAAPTTQPAAGGK
jgi:hypothetical protein